MLEQSLHTILPQSRVRTRLIDRVAYSTDASFYQLIPKAVVHPTSLEEMRGLFAWSREQGIPLTFRAAGSSLSGQAVTDGVLVDITRGFKNISVEKNGGLVRVGTAVRGGYANTILKKHGVKIGPDPASINTCMIGGIVANNASGMCCGTVQNSYHTLHSMTFMLTNGLVIDSAETNSDARLQEHAPNIAEGLLQLKREILDSPRLVERIRSKYRIKNTMGYSLNAFLDYESPVDILQHLLVGSEGTLGFISEVVFQTVPAYAHAYTGLLTFPTIDDACQAINPLRDSGAAAVELMDRFALGSVENLPDTPAWIRQLGKNECSLLVEYQFAEVEEMHAILAQTNAAVQQSNLSREPAFTRDAKEQALYWKIRKGMMPTIGAMRPAGTCLVNEDVAFKPGDLANGVRDLRQLMISEGYPNGIIFGHAKDGNMHFILPKEIRNDEQLRHYGHFMDRLAELIVGKYDGSLKAEHSTGRNMAPYLELEWGSEAYAIMRRLKKLLDPENILNPDVIISDDKQLHTKNIKLLPAIEEEVDRCIECGFCESHCPSRELTLTPRQRIGVRRQMKRYEENGTALYGADLQQLQQDFGYDALETCAVDGLCSTACPVGINTGDLVKRLRAEEHTRQQKKLALWCAKNFGTLSSLAAAANGSAKLAATILGGGSVEAIAAFANRLLATPRWNKHIGSGAKITARSAADDACVYFPTCSTRSIGSVEGDSLSDVFLRLCQRAAKKVRIAPETKQLCCGNVFSSKGYNEAHDTALSALINSLYHTSDKGRLPIIIDSSSCTYSILSAQQSAAQKGNSLLSPQTKEMFGALGFVDLAEYLLNEIAPLLPIKQKEKNVVLHPVCASVKMNTVGTMQKLAQLGATRVSIPQNAGCCGFAGDRGLLHPELTASATKAEADEVKGMESAGCYSTNTTCEIAMTSATGRQYRSIAFLVEESLETI